MADAGNRGKARLKRTGSLTRLRRYKQKRDFSRTAEPSDKSGAARTVRGKGKTKQLIFVIQKHAARRLHWDFRLEWQGTLRSWAVPKGPSLDPADKRLAVEVEDHPIAYAKFSGDIPKGEYGGGHVDTWDDGTWEPLTDPEVGFAKGRLEFLLHGKKLGGKWYLVRTRMVGRQTQWLLMKSRDEAARAGANADVIDAAKSKPADAPQPRSSRSKGTRGRALPPTLKPQLATLVDQVPGDEGWVYE